jgi:beta-lactamase regulating signal transducer with metallopeptidase domain
MTTESLIALLTLWIIKPLLIIVVIFLGAFLLRKTSAALQHFWLATGVFAVLLLPLLSPFMPTLEWQILPAAGNHDQNPIIAWCYSLMADINQPQLLLAVFTAYTLVATWMLFYFLLGLWQLRLQTRAASACSDAELQTLSQELCVELGIERRVNLLISKDVRSPQMWGLWRATITLPINAAHWSSERKLAVLIHELGHVARYDWATTIVVKVVCALFWFLPPVWWLAARLDHCAEMACDDFIYRLRDKHLAYAESLLAFAQPLTAPSTKPLTKQQAQPMTLTNAQNTRTGSNTPALSMAGHAPMFYRIQAILDSRRSHSPVAPEARQYWVLTLTMLLLPLAALQLMPIRETLLVNLLIVQEAGNRNNIPIVAPTTNANDHETRLLTSETLRQLKQEIISNDYPHQLARQVDNVTVVAERPTLGNDWAIEADEVSLAVALPSIRIEGYMPLDTMIPVYPHNALQRGIEV